MYLSASNSLSVNGQPIIDNFYESTAPTPKEIQQIEEDMMAQDMIMEGLISSISPQKERNPLLVASTTGLGATLDIFI